MFRPARFACVTLLALPAFAFAQADDTAVPAATCVKPVVPAINATLTKAASDKLNAESTAYATCSSAYIAARRATTAKYQAVANAHVDASNKFTADFNAFAASLEAFSKAQAAKKQ